MIWIGADLVRELERAGRGETAPAQRQAIPLAPDARLVREWNGKTIAIEVRPDGFWWKEQSWCSLSEIAREVTGAHWSGPCLFGHNRRPEKQSRCAECPAIAVHRPIRSNLSAPPPGFGTVASFGSYQATGGQHFRG